MCNMLWCKKASAELNEKEKKEANNYYLRQLTLRRTNMSGPVEK